MKLVEYLSDRKIDAGDFARRIGVTREAVRLWLAGGRQPSSTMMRRIVAETEGNVQPNDFFELPAASAPETTEAR